MRGMRRIRLQVGAKRKAGVRVREKRLMATRAEEKIPERRRESDLACRNKLKESRRGKFKRVVGKRKR